jgi:hypothetical protein
VTNVDDRNPSHAGAATVTPTRDERDALWPCVVEDLAIRGGAFARVDVDRALNDDEPSAARMMRVDLALLDALGAERSGSRDEYAIDLATPGLVAALDHWQAELDGTMSALEQSPDDVDADLDARLVIDPLLAEARA